MKELTEHQQNLIDRLFEGRLPKGEQGELEKAMEDADFRAAVKFRRDIRQAFAIDAQSHTKKNETVEKPTLQKTKPRVVSIRRVMAIAAGVLVLVLVGWFGKDLIFTPAVPVALEFLDIPPRHSVAGGPSAKDLLIKGKDAFYTRKKFKQAEVIFTQIASSSAHFSEAQYLLAHSLMQQQKFAEAIPVFDSFLQNESKFEGLPGRYRSIDQIRFERMLGYLGSGQNNAFIPELEFFLNHTDIYFKNKAIALQQRLEED